MGVKRFFLLFIMYGTVVFFLSGCWDMVNIEDRGFVIGTAIDMVDEQKEGNYTVSITDQFVNPAGYGTPAQGAGQKEAFKNKTVNGVSIFMIDRDMTTRIARSPYFEHLKMVVVSEEVARIPDFFASIMDNFIRYQQMRRGIKILISDGKAKNILQMDPALEKTPVKFINSTIDNSFKNLEVIKPVEIGELHGALLNQASYVLPIIKTKDDGIHYDGVAVFHGKDNHMVGKLDGEETKGLNFITSKAQGGGIDFEIDDHLMMLEIENLKSKTKIDMKDPRNPLITVDIKAEGEIAEMFGHQSLLDHKYLKEIEKKAEEKIEQLTNNTIKKAQQELKTDIFGFYKVLKQRHYDAWQKVKNDWEMGENHFAKSNVDVKVNVYVRGIGASDRAKDKGNKK